VDPDDRANVVAVSGQDLVPVLVDGDEVITDSTRIMHWLDERYPERPVFPSDPQLAANVEIFIDWFNRVWKREPNLIADALDSGRTEGEDLDRWTGRLQRRLDLFEGMLTGREHLFGEFGAADCAAWPFLRYAVGIDQDDPWTFHKVINERMALQDRHVNLRAWIGRIGERPIA
jgi:glutathione S-transferase